MLCNNILFFNVLIQKYAKMKKILGLDLGTASIGWALVNEAESPEEKSSIIKLGVRVNPLTTDEKDNFEKGKSITTNADRTLKRSMRRNNQRYKLRREDLIYILLENKIVSDDTIFSEEGNKTTFETYYLRSKAAKEKISLEEFARVLLMINKKRGYKSSRKAKDSEDGQLIDGMSVAIKLYKENLTPGEYVLELLQRDKKLIPDFYRSDLQKEFDKIWNFQKQFYPNILTDELKEELKDKNKSQTWKICEKPFGIVGIKRNVKGDELKKENYEWRVKALSDKMDLEELAIVLQEINGQIKGSSGYLGDISDRSKILYLNKLTVGEYLQQNIEKDSHFRIKNKVFYRQDYLDEFEQIWETQAKYHKELTPELKETIRDIIIFYQRPLKSQKGLISFCEFESKQREFIIDGKKKVKTIGLRVCPKSSPLFQEFKIWQILNNVNIISKQDGSKRPLCEEEKDLLFNELNIKDKLAKNDALKILFDKESKYYDLNYNNLDGNRTNAVLFNAYQKIIEATGHGEYDFSKLEADKVYKIVEDVFNGLGYNTNILHFDSELEGSLFQQQDSFKLWHLLYSYEGDKSKTGNEKLIDKISKLTGFEEPYAKILAKITFDLDYGNLSSKAMRKILPYMKAGNEYSVACEYAGYRHSKDSLTKEELKNKVLKDKLELLPKNSLRNPVVEKILNQMINVVNSIIDKYGKPDEIRVELSRDLKNSAKEREDKTKAINESTKKYDKLKEVLKKEFGIKRVSRNDLIRYRLYEELKTNGYKTLYSNTYIPREKLFSKEFDVEHIIPQAKLFDDSFSNKTLELRSVNLEKSNLTAFDYVKGKYDDKYLNDYKERLKLLLKDKSISQAKYNKLLMEEKDIPDGFIDRDKRDSQYIAKKSREILSAIVPSVGTTTGSVTSRLREDWQIVNVLQELNWNKYNKAGLTETFLDKDGRTIYRIIDWNKRNDHRHHAMDALAVAFTKDSYIQYLNNLNARSNKSSSIYGIEKKELYRDQKGHLRFYPPMPLDEFRTQAKQHLESILVSIKAKNKVTTQNTNITKKKGGVNKKIQLTPRGQLHEETIYGKMLVPIIKEEKLNSKFDYDKIQTVTKPKIKEALLKRLEEYDNDPKKAFSKANLTKKPIYLDDLHTLKVPEKVKTKSFDIVYTVRKEVNKDLNVDKVIDDKVRTILQKRLDEFGGKKQDAFKNLDENPIWLNKEKNISIKRVKVKGINNAVALHDKKDHNGKLILKDGNTQPVDFVSTGNNHHIAIYRDSKGNLQENVVTFFEAVTRSNLGLPIIDKEYKKSEGWTFLFTMKQNEYFVFPNEELKFDPKDIDLKNPDNYRLISPNLFRVQVISSKYYVFRHHLETSVKDESKELRDITWKRIRTPKDLNDIVKVRVNHLGEIVQIGEY